MITICHHPVPPSSGKMRYALARRDPGLGEAGLYLPVRIPVLAGADNVIHESILECLKAARPSSSRTPIAPMRRARMRLWTMRVYEVMHLARPRMARVASAGSGWIGLGLKAAREMVEALPYQARRPRQLALHEDGYPSSQSRGEAGKTARALAERLFPNGATPGIVDISTLRHCTAPDASGLIARFPFNMPGTAAEMACARDRFAASGPRIEPANHCQADETHSCHLARSAAGARLIT